MNARTFPPPEFAKFTLVSPRLSELAVADEATITIHTQGCFGGSVYRIAFRGPMPLKAEVSGAEHGVAIADLTKIGETTLSSDDVLRLDRLIAFYRSGPGDDCTTRSEIQIEWHIRGDERFESFTDGSGEVGESESVLSLHEVASRAGAKP